MAADRNDRAIIRSGGIGCQGARPSGEADPIRRIGQIGRSQTPVRTGLSRPVAVSSSAGTRRFDAVDPGGSFHPCLCAMGRGRSSALGGAMLVAALGLLLALPAPACAQARPQLPSPARPKRVAPRVVQKVRDLVLCDDRAVRTLLLSDDKEDRDPPRGRQRSQLVAHEADRRLPGQARGRVPAMARGCVV